MKWLRYWIVMLSFMLFSPMVLAGKDPIGWSVSGGIPSQAVANLIYPGITYTFINNLPFKMESPLYIVKHPNPPSDFSFTADTCSGVALNPGQTCIVSFTFFATTFGMKSVFLEEQYGRNVVPLPALTTNVGPGPTPLVTGTVTIPLPPNMGAGDRAPFQFTYTNTNNGTVPNVISSAVTINPNPGGTGTFFGPIIDTCAVLPGSQLSPGQSCTVTGTFQAGIPGTYTLHHNITYLPGGAASTFLTTTTNATQQVTGVASTPLPANMGAGESQPFEFTFTNNSTLPAAGPIVVNLSSVGGRAGTPITGVTDNCTGAGPLLGGASCTVSGTFNSGPAGNYSVTADFNYAGGTVSVTTNSVGTVLVVGAATTPLPSPNMGAGERQPVVFTYTNTGTGTVNNVAAVTIGPVIGGTFTPDAPTPNVTCGNGTATQLAPGASCIMAGVFASGFPGNYSVRATFNYDGGTGVAPVTTTSVGIVRVTGSPTTPLPNPMGAGEQQPVVFTFTNNGTGTIYGITAPTAGPTVGGTFTPDAPTPNVTCGNGTATELAPGGSCILAGEFASGVPGNYSVTASFNYAGGNNVASTTTTSVGTILITGSISPALPASVGLGEHHTVVVTYTNTGSGTAYGITDPTSATNFIVSGGTCVSGPTTDCGPFPAELPGTPSTPANSCTVTCNFEPNTAGTVSISSTMTYAGGTTTAVTTTSTASQKVVASTPIAVPAATTTATPYPFEIRFTNTGTANVFGGTAPTVTVSPGPQTTIVLDAASANCTAVTGLPPSQACVQTGTFTPTVAGSYTIFSSWTFNGGTVSITPMTTTTTFARIFTINNYCDKDVWFSFTGAPVRNGCSDKNSCPKGSTCNVNADNGKGICYWTNPSPIKGGFHLGPMTGNTPATSKVMINDSDPKNNIIWSGSLAGRTGCSGKNCETADCNSGGGDKSCPPGNTFATPTTFAQFTLNRSDEDTYSVNVNHGVNIAMSMGPSNPSKTTPAYDVSKPYYCATPGSSDDSKIFSACSWMFKPPAYPNASSAISYVWVKPGIGGVCSTNACPTSEVCGLSFSEGKFAQVCGKKLGYWTANQACLLNASSASLYFDCKNALTQSAGDALKELNACTNAKPGEGNASQMCVGVGNKEKSAMVQWLKSACPSVTAFSGDSTNSIYTCNTTKTTKASSTTKEIKINVTDYTISFCPEMAPSSPFRNLQMK